MNSASTEGRSIDISGREKTVRRLLDNVKYTIDYYQREYKWQAKNITELLSDLAYKFEDYYSINHSRKLVRNYGAYFLGSIVISRKNGQNFIIDGQQRLTSLTLLLIYLHNLQKKDYDGDIVDVQRLIFSESFGEKSFNFDIPERKSCMEALFNGNDYDTSEERNESVLTIVSRYEDIIENFPDNFKKDALPYFIDWLRERVFLVEITAYSDEDAYIIFETMNDRGLSLSPTDMLKGYLLSNITDDDQRDESHIIWRKKILNLLAVGKEEEIDFFKTWLRAKYADTIRDRKKGAKNQDWEHIGTTFHKWVRDESEDLGLLTGADYSDFITIELDFFAKQYIKLLEAADSYTKGMEVVYFNAKNNFTLQYPVLLSPLLSSDDNDTISKKFRLTGTYIDIYIARRVWNFKTLGYSSIQYAMFNLMKDVRNKSVEELASILSQKVNNMGIDFRTQDYLRMHQQNKRYIPLNDN